MEHAFVTVQGSRVWRRERSWTLLCTNCSFPDAFVSFISMHTCGGKRKEDMEALADSVHPGLHPDFSWSDPRVCYHRWGLRWGKTTPPSQTYMHACTSAHTHTHTHVMLVHIKDKLWVKELGVWYLPFIHHLSSSCHSKDNYWWMVIHWITQASDI